MFGCRCQKGKRRASTKKSDANFNTIYCVVAPGRVWCLVVLPVRHAGNSMLIGW